MILKLHICKVIAEPAGLSQPRGLAADPAVVACCPHASRPRPSARGLAPACLWPGLPPTVWRAWGARPPGPRLATVETLHASARCEGPGTTRCESASLSAAVRCPTVGLLHCGAQPSASQSFCHGVYCCLVAESCLTLCNPMDCSPPGSSVHGILRARILSGLPCPSPGDLPDPGANLCLMH